MASTYSTDLKIELIGTGDQSGTWGATTNTNLGTLIEQAIVGYVTQAVTDGAATVLTIPNGTSSNGRNYVIELTGALTANRTVEVPAVDKPYTFFNNTTGGFSVTVKVNGQTGVTIANGKKAIVYTNSTDVIEVVNAPVSEAGTQTLTNKTLTSPTISGGTINNAVIGGSTPAAGTFTSLSDSGNLTFTGTGNRITGDFTNATQTNKVAFQTSTTDGATVVASLPNGTGTTSQWRAYNNSDPTNAAWAGVVGSSSAAQFHSGIAGTGTYLPMTFLTNGSERMRIDTSGNVGIGSTAPNLSSSSTALTINTGTAANYSAMELASGGTLNFYINANNAASYIASAGTRPMAFYTNSSERMRIDSSGNLGYGATPSTTYALRQLYMPTNGGTAILGSSAYHTSNAYYDTAWKYYAAGGAANYAQASNVHTWSYAASGSANAAITWVEAMRIDSSGNVGIGTSSPGQKLTVAGGSIQLDTATAIAFGNINTRMQGAVDGSYIWYGNSTERMRIDSSGNLLLNTTTANGLLSIDRKTSASAIVHFENNATNGAWTAYSYNGTVYGYIGSGSNLVSGAATSDFVFRSTANTIFGIGTAEKMRIDTNGYVGIGVTSLTAMLQVAGSSAIAGVKTPNILEPSTVSATAATGTINYDAATQSVLYYTSNASANWTLNIRASSGTSLNTFMATGDTLTIVHMVTQGTTAYYNSAVQVDGSSVTPKWQGGTAPTAGNASGIDIYTYTVIKTASATFTVLASQTQFK